MQTNLDLRARFAAVVDGAEPEVAAPAAPQRRPFMTENRTRLFRDMLFERFDADEAQARFNSAMLMIKAAEESGHPREVFERFFSWLKLQPKRNLQPKAEPKGERVALQVTVPLIEGYFTVVMSEDVDDYRTFEITRQDEDDKFMPGRLVLGYLSGQSNYTDYTRFGHVTEDGRVVIWSKHRGNADLAEAVKVLVGDPKAAASAYFKASQNCAKCGQRITRADSLKNAEENGGLGPKCAGDARAAGW